MSSDLIKTHMTVATYEQHYEAGITVTLSGSKEIAKQRKLLDYYFDSHAPQEWVLRLTLDGNNEKMHLGVSRSSKAKAVNEAVMLYEGECAVALPAGTTQKEFSQGLINPGGATICEMGPLDLPDEDIVITVRIAYSRATSDVDLVVCQLPTVERLSTQISTAYELLFRMGVQSDVTFVVGDEEVPAHKVILTARFPYFASMMSSGMVEAQTNRVKIEDADVASFKSVLKYIYCGKLPDDLKETARLLLPLADRFDLPELREGCLHWMDKGLSKENVCDTLIAADLYHCADLKKKCLRLLNRWKSSIADDAFDVLESYPKLLVELVKIGE